MCEEPVRDNVLCLYEGEVQPNEAPLSPPTASPTVTLGRWCWQWLVTVSCTPLSSLHPSHPLLPCSTFIWPHLLPLAFNAELGSPLIKVKASQCLAETERKWETEGKGRQRGGERDRGRKGEMGFERKWWKREKLLYRCTINLLWNTDELEHHFTCLAESGASRFIIVTSVCSHQNSYVMVRGQHVKYAVLRLKRVIQWFSNAPP